MFNSLLFTLLIRDTPAFLEKNNEQSKQNLSQKTLPDPDQFDAYWADQIGVVGAASAYKEFLAPYANKPPSAPLGSNNFCPRLMQTN